MNERLNYNTESTIKSPLISRRTAIITIAGAISGISVGVLWKIFGARPEEVEDIDLEELTRAYVKEQLGTAYEEPPTKPVFKEPESKEKIHSGTVLIFFSAHWCGPCGSAGTFLEQQESFLKEHGIKPFEFFEAEEKAPNPLALALMTVHGSGSFPTVLILSNGKLIKKFQGIGGVPENDIMKIPDWISDHPDAIGKK